MPTCAQCDQPYREDYDACPRCAKRLGKVIESIKSNVGGLYILAALSLIGSVFALLAQLG